MTTCHCDLNGRRHKPTSHEQLSEMALHLYSVGGYGYHQIADLLHTDHRRVLDFLTTGTPPDSWHGLEWAEEPPGEADSGGRKTQPAPELPGTGHAPVDWESRGEAE